MKTVAKTREETAAAKAAIREELSREGVSTLSRAEITECRNGHDGELTATAIHNAILELLEREVIEYSPDRRLRLRNSA